MKKENFIVRCSECNSPKVVKNVQMKYVEYDYNHKTFEYSDNIVFEHEIIDNYHYCEKCYEKWNNGELDN